MLTAAAHRCEKLRLILVHAQNDGTMPWSQSEKLFASTLRAATDEAGIKIRVVDLGEAGKQEVWRHGARSISKLIAKHGGKMHPTRHLRLTLSQDRKSADDSV